VFLAIRDRLEKDEEGFTLIELLVVIIIIGILAAIAIPTFLNQRKKGWDAASKSELRNAAVAQESYFTDNNKYTATPANLEAEGFNNSAPFKAPGSFTPTVDATGTKYCMQAAHAAQTDVVWALTSDGGEPVKGKCSAGVLAAP
jgi:type IV pilus assembly protein PilA